MATPRLVVHTLNSVLRFGLELAALYGLASFGYSLGTSTVTRLGGVVALPAAMIAVWGGFVAPKARVKPPIPVRLALELLVFGGAAYAFASTRGATFGWSFLVVSTLSSWVNAGTAK